MKSEHYFRQLDREFTAHPYRINFSLYEPTDEQIEEMHDAGAPWRLCECDLCDALRVNEEED